MKLILLTVALLMQCGTYEPPESETSEQSALDVDYAAIDQQRRDEWNPTKLTHVAWDCKAMTCNDQTAWCDIFCACMADQIKEHFTYSEYTGDQHRKLEMLRMDGISGFCVSKATAYDTNQLPDRFPDPTPTPEPTPSPTPEPEPTCEELVELYPELELECSDDEEEPEEEGAIDE